MPVSQPVSQSVSQSVNWLVNINTTVNYGSGQRNKPTSKHTNDQANKETLRHLWAHADEVSEVAVIVNQLARFVVNHIGNHKIQKSWKDIEHE